MGLRHNHTSNLAATVRRRREIHQGALSIIDIMLNNFKQRLMIEIGM